MTTYKVTTYKAGDIVISVATRCRKKWRGDRFRSIMWQVVLYRSEIRKRDGVLVWKKFSDYGRPHLSRTRAESAAYKYASECKIQVLNVRHGDIVDWSANTVIVPTSSDIEQPGESAV